MSHQDSMRATKATLRERLLAARRARPESERRTAARALTERVVEHEDVRRAGVVSCYVSMAEEPGTAPLLEALHEHGATVLLPVLTSGADLDWARFRPGALHPGRFGILEPDGPRLGAAGIGEVSVAICPGLAGDLEGRRIGRGRGYYDRALARLGASVPRLLLLYDDEVLDLVPATGRDERVDVLVTPERTLQTRRAMD